MNRVKIYGGLGNQMFQYALNIALTEKGKKSKIIFTNFFYDDHHNGFNLGYAFKLKLSYSQYLSNYLLNNAQILYKRRIINSVIKKLFRLVNSRFNTYIEKDEFVFDKELFNQSNTLFLGTWQVATYFSDIEMLIRKEFLFREPSDDLNKMIITHIKKQNAVSVHIRRGDYTKIQWSATHQVIKDSTYYINSLKYIEKYIENPHYFIFSDDIDWVKENLEFSNCTYINHNTGKDNYLDMYLMSLCNHNIIANSTFSWWGAWLNNNSNKIVIMPEKWLNNRNCEGIYPANWIRMTL